MIGLGAVTQNTPDGGVIEVTVERKNGSALFYVKDYGVGITEENQKFLLDWTFSHQGDGPLIPQKNPMISAPAAKASIFSASSIMHNVMDSTFPLRAHAVSTYRQTAIFAPAVSANAAIAKPLGTVWNRGVRRSPSPFPSDKDTDLLND